MDIEVEHLNNNHEVNNARNFRCGIFMRHSGADSLVNDQNQSTSKKNVANSHSFAISHTKLHRGLFVNISDWAERINFP